MSECIVKCGFSREEPMTNGYKNVWIKFKAENDVKLTVKYVYKKDAHPETMVLVLSKGDTEEHFVIFDEAEKITLFITDVATRKSWTIEVPLILGGEVRYK